MTTNFVLTGDCPNFPILYHWRVLPIISQESTADGWEKLGQDVTYWNNSAAIRGRLQANLQASASIVLFLEYIPENLYKWFGDQVKQGDAAVESACRMIENNLTAITSFINPRELLHFDAHFSNILTDGERLYFSDFGLALSSKFELSDAEIDFFKYHLNYDQYSSVINFLHCIITHYFGKDKWIISLQEYLAGKHEALSPFVSSIIKRYAEVALLMDRFYRALQKDKTTIFPVKELDYAWAKIHLRGMSHHEN